MIGYQFPRSAEISQDLISHAQSNRVINETVIEMINIRRDVEENESRILQAILWMPMALYRYLVSRLKKTDDLFCILYISCPGTFSINRHS